ncbi:Alpha-L-arabinofuranosidase [Mucilaginibacter gossypiicola]|uniref:non-reducing end alpha-L-arabinofuranosidase n=1 Tax=Mucilaginibacter gossypiicola TaxID=551995 RepID=A0A1H8NYA8_9SPHI|nr:alpha-L-arabinofuranosidase C-terminal domain-containing protein [Mucilaginibacter gossypiicola]SEO34554.1 Alpha-L-arabinofuranosidase [Mucilaginibacter gossypiicola]
MLLKTSTARLYLFALLALPLVTFAQQAQITVDASRVLNRVPSNLYGACIEDVNHEIYGGLYDQRIFGESFEEPAAPPVISGWKSYDGYWQPGENSISVNAGEGFKLIKQQSPGTSYTAEVLIKFGLRNDNAGIVVNVNNANKSADNFDGYEISLDPNKRVLVFGKHHNNWTPISETKLSIDFKSWIKLKVENDGNVFKVYLNDEKPAVATLTDDKDILPAGSFGLRTYNADVTYKNLTITTKGKTTTENFHAEPTLKVSGAWDAVNVGGAGSFSLDTSDSYNGKQSQIITHNGSKGVAGIANKSLYRWGIALHKGNIYAGSLFMKAEGFKGGVTLSLQSADGKKVYGTQVITNITSGWMSYPFAIKSLQSDTKARFVISINNKGKLWVDHVTLMCKQEQFKSLPLRADIGTAMQQEGLNFLRYGGTMVNAPGYRFKKMIGTRNKRPPYTGHWYPYSTNGFGIEEFLQFCEAAGFEPAFAINIEETPQDMADMVEYLKGDASTQWGKQRAANGHPAPYKIKYIEIGNEEVIFNGDIKSEYEHYAKRFNLLQSAMHAKDTTLKFICSAWWRSESPNMALVFKAIDGKANYWDLHTDADNPDAGIKVDSSLTRMKAIFTAWNPNTHLKCTIFEENGGRHDISRALGHASTLNAVRRHGDFVLTSCAANALQPLGQNDNGWDQGQVFFTPSQVWGMPPFYAQQMASANHLPLNIASTTTGQIDVSATLSEDRKQLVLHVVNPAAKPVTADIKLSGFEKRNKEASIMQLTGDLKEVNTPAQPTLISPKSTHISWPGDVINYTLPAASYTIIRFNR